MTAAEAMLTSWGAEISHPVHDQVSEGACRQLAVVKSCYGEHNCRWLLGRSAAQQHLVRMKLPVRLPATAGARAAHELASCQVRGQGLCALLWSSSSCSAAPFMGIYSAEGVCDIGSLTT